MGKWLEDAVNNQNSGDSIGSGSTGSALQGTAASLQQRQGDFEGGASTGQLRQSEDALLSSISGGAAGQSQALYGQDDNFSAAPSARQPTRIDLLRDASNPESYGGGVNTDAQREELIYGKGGLIGAQDNPDLTTAATQPQAQPPPPPPAVVSGAPLVQGAPPTAEPFGRGFVDILRDQYQTLSGGLSKGLDKAKEYGVDIPGNEFDPSRFASTATGSPGIGSAVGLLDSAFTPNQSPTVSPAQLNLPALPPEARTGMFKLSSGAVSDVSQKQELAKLLRQLTQR